MSKFTSGTWSVGIDGTYGPYVYADDGDAIIAVIRSCGHISESEKKEAVRQANARLIAAAPEMYEVIKALLEEPPLIGPNYALMDATSKARKLVARIDGVEVSHD